MAKRKAAKQQLPAPRRRARLVPPPGGFTHNIPSQNLGLLDTRTDAERAAARAAYDVWRNDLEYIRRAKPLLDTANEAVGDITINRHTRLSSFNASKGSTTAAASGSARTPAMVVDLSVESDAQPGESADGPELMDLTGDSPVASSSSDKSPDQDSPEFYGYDGKWEKLLQYQKRDRDMGKIPGPGMLRFDMDRLLDDISRSPRQQTRAQLTATTREQLFADGKSRPLTFEESLQENWLKDTVVGGGARLLRGFPMMEDVVFYRAGNFGGIASNCLWKAVAYQVYGDLRYDIRVKAEHLEYYSEVLRWPQHPKHELYTQMNKRFHKVAAADRHSCDTVANLYQLMHIPCSYQPMDMFEITADLYDLFITVYQIAKINKSNTAPTYDPTRKRTVQNVTMRGSYNARHVFFLYLAGTAHFQPMVPNDFIASEFKQPLPTWKTTYGYPTMRIRNKNKDELATQHAWRRDGLERDLIDRAAGLPPVTPLCDEYWIGAVVNGTDSNVTRK
ncbi:unnamed protein product [Discula destructiva]